MASLNPFDLLGDNDNDDPSQLAASHQPKAAPATPAVPKKAQPPSQAVAVAAQKLAPAKLPAKPLPPAQAVREARNDSGGRGGGRGGRRGFGRGGRGPGYNREGGNEIAFTGASGGSGGGEDDLQRSSGRRDSYVDRPRGPFRGGRHGGFSNGENGDAEHLPQRQFERRSGTGRGNEFKRDGSGRGNWGTPTDEVLQETEELPNSNEKVASPEKQPGEEEDAGANKENTENETEKEPEDKEMTLEEYEKVLEEKRKALQGLKTEERKVTLDKDLKSMKQLSNKKENNDIFIKLGSDKDKRKDGVDKEERVKKAVSINEFLKPADGEAFYNPGGRGRGRGRGGFRGGYSGGRIGNNVPAPSITDDGQFPTLGA